jgi:hypothetical protein
MSDWKFVIGGSEKDLYTDYGIRVTGVTGAGMPPIDNISTRYALADGAAHQRAIARERVIQLACVYEQKTQYQFHAARKSLIAAINRDVLDGETFTLRYYGTTSGTECLEIPVRYEGGLEMEYAAADALRPFAIRLKAEDPSWFTWDESSGGYTTSTLGVATTVADANYIMMRGTDGTWRAMGGGLSGEVYEISVDPMTSRVYVGGSFTTAYNAASGGSAVTVKNITYWDGDSWCTCGAGVTHTTATSAVVKAIEFGADGNVYVGGLFTTAGTAAIDSLAVYDADTNTWPTAAWSFNGGVYGGEVRGIARAANGDLWIGGTFTNIRQPGGTPVSNTPYLGQWDYSEGNYSVPFTTAPNYDVTAIVMAPDGETPIFGGAVSSVDGVTVNRVGEGGYRTYAAMGAGVGTNRVYALKYGPDGMLYAGGDFVTADGAAAYRVAKWNGGGWAPIGAGLGGSVVGSDLVRDIAIDDAGIIYAACPAVTTSGRVTLIDQFAVFSDGSWHSLDIDMPGSAVSRAVAIDGQGKLYIGYNAGGNAITPTITTVTNNGTASAYPIFIIKRTGGTSATIQSIVNWTTGKEIIMPYSMDDGEEVTIDLTPGAKSVSSDYRGSLLSKVIGGTGLQTFTLIPGANKIAVFVTSTDTPTISAKVSWRERHWSADGV